MGKDYFLVSKDQIRGMEKSVSAEQFRAVIMAMLEIDDGMEPQVSDQVVAYIVNSKADQAKEHRKNWETKQKIARENGAKGGRPSKPTGTDKNPENQQEPVGTNQNQEKPIKPTETDKTNKNPANANASASVFVDVDANAVVDNFETDANVDNFSPVPAKLPTTAVIFVNKNEKYKTRNPNTVVIEKTGAGALKFLELVAETSKKQLFIKYDSMR